MQPSATVARAALAVLGGVLLAAGAPRARGVEAASPGAREFMSHCAVCHGVDGRGNGPMADKLTRRPKDLTLLSRKNGGSFPETVVYQIVDGRRIVLFHGTREMPIWGDRFRAEGDDAAASARVSALVSYLAGIQVE